MAQRTARLRWLPLLVVAEGIFIVCMVAVLIYFVLHNQPDTDSPVAGAEPIITIAAAPYSAPGMQPATATIIPGPLPSLFPTSTQPPTQIPTLWPIPPTLQHPSTAWSIVFTCTPEKYNQICLMGADGSHPRRLTSRQANDYYPSFAPGGKSVVFVSNQSGSFGIYSLDLQTGQEHNILAGLGNVTAPEISPDGKWIVFASKFGSDSSIWVSRSDGSQPHALTDARWNEIDPTWSPDGSQIAFAGMRGGYVELFVMDADGKNIRQVTQGIKGIGGRSSWSPDGKRLVFYAGPSSNRDIYVVDIAKGQTTRLTQGGNNTGPDFSHDGEWIVFSSSRDGDHEIFTMRSDGSQVTQLTFNNYDDWQPRGSP